MNRLLGEIRHAEGLDPADGVVDRLAVRAIALRGRRLLMLYSPTNADYKLPGGGVEAGESEHDALRREVAEECGLRVRAIGAVFGDIVEYSADEFSPGKVFRMRSRYIRCQVEDGGFGAQRLEQYERELRLTPVWVGIDRALEVNAAAVSSPRWRRREIAALQLIRGALQNPDAG